MNGFVVIVSLLLLLVSPRRDELPPESLRLKEPTPARTIDLAFQKLSLPCPDRIHVNDTRFEEGDGFCYRPHDLYEDCADEMDALVKSKEPVEERLLQLGNKGKTLPERYRAVWILIQRRNRKVVAILQKMAASASAEERFLAWYAYTKAIRERQLSVPESFEAALAHCRKEKNRHVRDLIMAFLGACKAEEAVPLLLAAVKNDSGYSALDALGEIRDPRAVPAIRERAEKESGNRYIYFRALGKIGTEDAVDYLLEHLDEGSFAIEALFESGSPRALPAIEKYLDRLRKEKQPDELNLAVAEVSLLRLKCKDPREHLVALAEDRKQCQWMRTEALDALRHYDRKPLAGRILKLYRADKDDWMRMFYIRLLCDLPGKGITEAMIDHALTDNEEEYHHSHDDLLHALNMRLNTSFRTMPPLVERLRRERAARKK